MADGRVNPSQTQPFIEMVKSLTKVATYVCRGDGSQGDRGGYRKGVVRSASPEGGCATSLHGHVRCGQAVRHRACLRMDQVCLYAPNFLFSKGFQALMYNMWNLSLTCCIYAYVCFSSGSTSQCDLVRLGQVFVICHMVLLMNSNQFSQYLRSSHNSITSLDPSNPVSGQMTCLGAQMLCSHNLNKPNHKTRLS